MVPAQGVSPAGSAPLTAILTGPTAAGKTGLALEIARESRGGIEIVNADSMVVYRGMDIGTAKPTRAELEEVRHHLVDIRDPDQPYTAGDFTREAEAALAGIHARGKRALIVGGTGFYLKALLFGMWEAPAADPGLRARLEAEPLPELHARLGRADPASAARIGPADRYRLVRAVELLELTGRTPSELQAARPPGPDPRFALWVADRDPAELEARIRERAGQMVRDGLLDETQALRARYPGARPLKAVGYREACAYLDGEAPAGRAVAAGLPGLVDEITLATRQLVKRQRTWFRSLLRSLPREPGAGGIHAGLVLPTGEWREILNRIY